MKKIIIGHGGGITQVPNYLKKKRGYISWLVCNRRNLRVILQDFLFQGGTKRNTDSDDTENKRTSRKKLELWHEKKKYPDGNHKAASHVV